MHESLPQIHGPGGRGRLDAAEPPSLIREATLGCAAAVGGLVRSPSSSGSVAIPRLAKLVAMVATRHAGPAVKEGASECRPS
mmetsp:Transcript_21932/g.35148  ORF Transcript_21932/g.35148 Transcript_21932/m.35148 type:complete len:82 (+) Transcript_21932:107-352(+)